MAKKKDIVDQVQEVQAEAQEGQTVVVLVLDSKVVSQLMSIVAEKPANEVFQLLTELNAQMQSQAEIVKFVKDAPVSVDGQEIKTEV